MLQTGLHSLFVSAAPGAESTAQDTKPQEGTSVLSLQVCKTDIDILCCWLRKREQLAPVFSWLDVIS